MLLPPNVLFCAEESWGAKRGESALVTWPVTVLRTKADAAALGLPSVVNFATPRENPRRPPLSRLKETVGKPAVGITALCRGDDGSPSTGLPLATLDNAPWVVLSALIVEARLLSIFLCWQRRQHCQEGGNLRLGLVSMAKRTIIVHLSHIRPLKFSTALIARDCGAVVIGVHLRRVTPASDYIDTYDFNRIMNSVRKSAWFH